MGPACGTRYFPLLVNFFTATRNSSVCMAVDDLVLLGIELLLDRRHRGLVDQRLGAGDRGRRILRQPLREFPRRGLQFGRRNDFGDQAPVIGLLRGKAVLGEKYLQARGGRRRVPTMPTVLPPSGDTPILA